MKKAATQWTFKYAALALAASLAACGGGGSGGFVGAGVGTGTGAGTGTGTGTGTGGSGAGVAASGAQISGVAAVGAPLVGTVTVKDALGATRTKDIGTNGSYAVDVSGMTAPFVFRAEGRVNGMTVTVHSLATQADIDGTINITQLTNLIVANIAGQIAANYFDKFEQGSNPSLASKALVDAEVGKLKEKLLPVFTALGVDAAIDLLHGTFTPLADPIDKALDVIRVQYDTAANTATISNILNTSTVVDDLAKQAAAEPVTTSPLSSDNVASGLSDQALVKKVLTDFAGKFANGLPASGDLTPLMTSGFMWNDRNRATWVAEFTQASDFVGISFADIEIHQINYNNANGVTARVSFTPKTPQGIELGRVEDWLIRKSLTDGIWRLHGDQRSLDLDWFATTSLHNGLPGSGTCVKTGIEFNIVDHNTTNNGGVINAIVVTGPGLPADGLHYDAAPVDERWKIAGVGQETYVMASSCTGAQSPLGDAAIGAIPDDAVYTLTPYDINGNKVLSPSGSSDGSFRMKVQRRPLTLAEAAGNGVFPVIAPATVTAFNGFVSGSLAFSASNVYPLSQAYVQMRRQNAAFQTLDQMELSVLPTASGTVGTSLDFGVEPLAVSSAMWVESPDRYRRNIQTYYYK
jgi:hypothetical protein